MVNSLGIDPEDLETSVHHVLTRGLDATEVIISTEEGVDLLPATIELARAEADLLTRTGREHVVKGVVEDLDGAYDWVLLDCPPSLGVLTVAALTAADGVLVPLQCETLSHRGVGQLLHHRVLDRRDAQPLPAAVLGDAAVAVALGRADLALVPGTPAR